MQRSYPHIHIVFLFTLAFLCFLLPNFSRAAGILSFDNFDSYSTGSISGQGTWVISGSAPNATSTIAFSPDLSLANGTSSAPYAAYRPYTGIPILGDTFSFRFYQAGSASGVNSFLGSVFANIHSGTKTSLLAFCNTDANHIYLEINNTLTTTCIAAGGSTTFTGVTKNEWHTIQFVYTGVNQNYAVYLDSVSGSTAGTRTMTFTDIGFSFLSSGASPYYIDDVGTGDFGSDTSTHIIAVDPYDGEVVSSTTVTTLIGDVYIAQADYTPGMTVHFSLTPYTNSPDCSYGPGIGCRGDPFELSADLEPLTGIDASGEHLASVVTDSILDEGKYLMVTTVKEPFLWFWDRTLVSTSTSFVVGAKTASDLNQEENDEAIRNALNISNGVASSTCAILTFNLAYCLGGLFVPNQELLDLTFSEFKDNVLTHFPLGYITDFYTIVSSTTTEPLVVLDAYMPSVLPGGGSHIVLDLTNVLDPYLTATSGIYTSGSATSTETFLEITIGYWKIIVYILALFYILARIFGITLIPSISKRNDNQEVEIKK